MFCVTLVIQQIIPVKKYQIILPINKIKNFDIYCMNKDFLFSHHIIFLLDHSPSNPDIASK